jgi:acylphosphatase
MVQGVGFRYTARSLSRGHDVTGYVKNVTDGSVELVAEGEEAAVKAFLASVDSRLGEMVRAREVKWLDPSGEFHEFSIRF